MAQAVLGGLGQALGGGIGQAIGRALGGMLDQRLVASLGPARQAGPRLESLRLQSTAEGAPMALVLGRARVTGQVIWAARFLEQRHEQGGGKGGPRTESYAYSLSFAVAVCEGPIDGIGRIWADGQPLDRAGATLRIHRGTEDQTPDPLIEAVEGATVPAYRGTAYVVFEDLPLAAFGNRVPQLAFEVFRRPAGEAALEDRLEGVCLIPGAGEFVLATGPVVRRTGLTRTEVENVSSAEGRPDLIVSLDQLTAACPNLKRVSLVIGWFGNDLRAGHCTIRPGVERRDKPTIPLDWSVAGLDRSSAHLVSMAGGAPAYGGTPSDDSVRQAVAELKARGLAVTLYPFVFMDIPPDNGLTDPYGGAEQAAYPWRGRIVAHDPAMAAADVTAVFGTPDGWGLRRLARHYAALAAETGADGLLIGSEMRGLTTSRDTGGGYPAVAEFRALLAECRAIVGPGVALSYAADWSEYSGHRPDDGSGDVMFHLDPLWADPALDYVGIDWYPPLGDWRAGDGGLDAESYEGPDDPDYLAMQMAGGEHFDWFYADEADRAAQVRTPIVDLAHGEDWVFRVKDLKDWWGHAHHDRPAGVRSATPTAWAPGMKPIRLTEFGCPAVDRGGNAPNLFQDPKSAEGALPPGSTGERDDRMQRRALEAVLDHFEDGAANPMSAVYGDRMLEGADAWCWDARPWPAFPGRPDLWADAPAWQSGHWLNGRLLGETQGLLADLAARIGSGDVPVIGPVRDRIEGYVVDRPMSVREALSPLVAGLGLVLSEAGGRLTLRAADDGPVARIDPDELALTDEGGSEVRDRTVDESPDRVRVRYMNLADDYQTGSVTLSRDNGGDGVAGLDVDLPAVCDEVQARRFAARLAAGLEGVERLTVMLGPLQALTLEPGDRVQIPGQAGLWRIDRIALDAEARAVLAPLPAPAMEGGTPVWRLPDRSGPSGAPWMRILELPPLVGRSDSGVVAVVAVEPWSQHAVSAGPDALNQTVRGVARRPASVGVLTEPLTPGPGGRWDETASLTVRVEGRLPESREVPAVLAGANAVAVETPAGWEAIQYRTAALVGGDVWRLSGLLRGQGGGEPEAEAGAAAGSAVVFLDDSLVELGRMGDERGLPLLWRAGALGAVPSGPFVSELGHVLTGRAERPWRPVHLRTRLESGGLLLSWIARVRTSGDGWDGEPEPVDPLRFRVRILDGEVERRAVEVAATEWLYADVDRAADFPGGDEAAHFAVAQVSIHGIWGPEAVAPLCEDGGMP